jgi:hypothetical protein
MKSLFLLILSILISNSIACKCVQKSIEEHFCDSGFLINAMVKSEKLISNEIFYELNVIQTYKWNEKWRVKRKMFLNKKDDYLKINFGNPLIDLTDKINIRYIWSLNDSCRKEFDTFQTYIISGRFVENGEKAITSLCDFGKKTFDLTLEEKLFLLQGYKKTICKNTDENLRTEKPIVIDVPIKLEDQISEEQYHFDQSINHSAAQVHKNKKFNDFIDEVLDKSEDWNKICLCKQDENDDEDDIVEETKNACECKNIDHDQEENSDELEELCGCRKNELDDLDISEEVNFIELEGNCGCQQRELDDLDISDDNIKICACTFMDYDDDIDEFNEKCVCKPQENDDKNPETQKEMCGCQPDKDKKQGNTTRGEATCGCKPLLSQNSEQTKPEISNESCGCITRTDPPVEPIVQNDTGLLIEIKDFYEHQQQNEIHEHQEFHEHNVTFKNNSRTESDEHHELDVNYKEDKNESKLENRHRLPNETLEDPDTPSITQDKIEKLYNAIREIKNKKSNKYND